MGFNSAFKGLMLFSETIAVQSEYLTGHKNTPCGYKAEILMLQHLVTYSTYILYVTTADHTVITPQYETANCSV